MDMKKIEANTKLTYQDYRDFFIFSQVRHRGFRSWPKISYIAAVTLLAISLLLTFVKGMPSLFWLTAYALTFVMSILALTNLALPKFQYKNVAYHLKLAQEFVILGNRINIFTHAGDSVLDFSDIRRVYETDDTFYIFISSSQAIILPKKDITQGTPMMLRTRLSNTLGKRYKKLTHE